MAELKTKRIAVLQGGRSSEREVSLWSGAAIHRALEERGYDVRSIDVDLEVAARLREEAIEVAFIGLHGRWGEDGCIQGLLESMAIPYTGSGVLASALAMNKLASKQVYRAHGIPTPDSLDLRSEEAGELQAAALPFPFPVVVKPASEGSSVGVRIAHNEEELAQACAEAGRYAGGVLVERYHPGREIHVAVLDDQALGAIEVLPAAEFYDYEAKYKSGGSTRYLCPAPLEEAERERVAQLAEAAHRALGCAGATRTDMMLGADGSLQVLETNTLPGMTESSLLPKIAAAAGLSFGDLCERILQSASLKA